MRRLLRVLLAASLLYGSGAHWAAVQAVAWGGMIAARAPQAGLDEALTTTFDGVHPCGVCLIVEKGAGREGPASAAVPSVHFIAIAQPILFADLVPAPAPVPPRLAAAVLPSRPASPPPKAALLA